MSTQDEESSVQELVIIRRRGGEDEGSHKGGVWKIAYADFMTAMMAFFLVMWLINATDKRVITQLANYFNPLRLTDKSPAARGLHDLDSGAAAASDAGQSKEADKKAKGAKSDAGSQKNPEEALLKDPYPALDRLAKEAAAHMAAERLRSGAAAMKRGQERLASGEAFRDPFDPEFQPKVAPAAAPPPDVPPIETKPQAAPAADQIAPAGSVDEVKPAEKALAKVDPATDRSASPPPAGETKDSGKATVTDSASAGNLPGADAMRSDTKQLEQVGERAHAVRLESEIKNSIAQLGSATAPDIDVKVVADGLLLSLTDKFDFGMFAIASAEPRPTTVAIMERIGRILQTRPGQLVVRGHTDGRPFRSPTYDNWRLSTARAHMAYYMLVRGGIDEKRFDRIEGHADRNLRVPQDSGAAQNRRIEILLRVPR